LGLVVSGTRTKGGQVREFTSIPVELSGALQALPVFAPLAGAPVFGSWRSFNHADDWQQIKFFALCVSSAST
jgi:hypothetical protein